MTISATSSPGAPARRVGLASAARSTAITIAGSLCLVIAASPSRAAESWSWGAGFVQGSGKLQTEARPLVAFQAITVTGSMRVVLRQGTREAVEVRADDNVIPLISTVVAMRHGAPTLEIGMRPGANFDSRNDVVVTVDLVRLEALALSGDNDVTGTGLKTGSLKVSVGGSGDVKLTALDAGDLNVRVSGSGNVEFSGHAPKLKLAIAGSGDAKTRALDADDVSVSIAGSGNADVFARRTLTASIAGSGDVSYTGDATVKSSVAGSGSVTKR